MLPSCSVSLGLHFPLLICQKMLTRPGKVAREQSASDIFMPLRVSFDRKSGEVLTRDVLLPRTSIFFAKCTFFHMTICHQPARQGRQIHTQR